MTDQYTDHRQTQDAIRQLRAAGPSAIFIDDAGNEYHRIEDPEAFSQRIAIEADRLMAEFRARWNITLTENEQ